MATNDPLGLYAKKPGTRSVSSAQDPLGLFAQEEDEEKEVERIAILQAGAGVLEGVLDPLSVIPYVDRKIDSLTAYRGDSVAGKIGYGVGAVGSAFVPFAPANIAIRAGTAAARGMRLVKKVERTEDLVELANRFVTLDKKRKEVWGAAGTLTQGGVAGALIGAGASDASETTAGEVGVNAAIGAVTGGLFDVALTPVWRAISGVGKVSKTLPPEIEDLAEQTLKSGAEDNAPVVASSKTASILGRALTLADDVIDPDDIEGTTGLAANLTRVLAATDEGMMRIIPKIGRGQDNYIDALKKEGLDVIETTRKIDEETVSDFLVAPAGSISKKTAEEFNTYGFLKGQSVTVKGQRGTILGLSEKNSSKFKILFGDGTIKELSRDAEEVLMLPISYITRGAGKKNIPKVSGLWSEFIKDFDSAYSNNALADEARKVGLATNTVVPPVERLSFDGAFDAFMKAKNVTGVERESLKGYFLRRHKEDLKAFIGEELDLIDELRKVNKSMHPEGSLQEIAATRGYEVIKEGKKHFVRDMVTGDLIPATSKKHALKLIKDHQRDLPEGLDDTPLPISADLLNTGGVGVYRSGSDLKGHLNAKSLAMSANLKIIPNEGRFRAVEDKALKAGVEFPIYSQILEPTSRVKDIARNAAAPWHKRFSKIVGSTWRRNISAETKENWHELLESPEKDWKNLVAEYGFTPNDIRAARETKKMLREIFAEHGETVGMTADDAIEWYFPRMMKWDESTGETLEQFMSREAASRNKILSPKSYEFLNAMKRTGRLTDYQTDPTVVIPRYIDNLFFKKHAAETFMAAEDTYKQLAEKYGKDSDLTTILTSARDYIEVAKGRAPAEMVVFRDAMNQFFEKTGMKAKLSERAFNNVITTMTTLNQSAFLGFRLSRAMIDSLQLGHVFIKEGIDYTARGVASASTRAGMKEAEDMGAVLVRAIRTTPFEDQASAQMPMVVQGEGMGAKLREAGQRTVEAGAWANNKINRWLRASSYHAQKIRAIEAYNQFTPKGRNLEFEEEAGLSAMGETITEQYYKILNRQGNEMAAKWLGVRAATDTQWGYQTGLGPELISRGPMKLIGQYGTWSSWWLNHAKRGLSVGTPKDRKRWAARTALFNGTIVATGYAAGINVFRWLGPTSMFYSGGPILDTAEDARAIFGGMGNFDSPHLKERLSLAKYGVGHDDETGYEWDDPVKTVTGIGANYTPGFLMGRDIMKAFEEEDPWRQAMTGIGFRFIEEE